MYPPPGGSAGEGRAPYRPVYQAPVEHTVLLVRPIASGVPVEFEPRSGAMRPAAAGRVGADGCYGELGGVTVVFYRLVDRLMVRVGGQTVDLGGVVHVGWERSAQRMTRFTLAVDGRPMCELIYGSVPPELDLGLMIRNVVAYPGSRMTVFSDRAI